MARQVLPIVGAIVGAYFGNPQLGWAIGTIIGNAVDPQVIKGPSIGDISQQTSQEGVSRPIVFAMSQPIAGNIIATSNPKIVHKTESQGKGGPKVRTEAVYRTYAVGVCEGVIGGFLRVWRNGILVYDVSANRQLGSLENAKFLQNARFFTGTYDQLPSPDLEQIFGVGTTPAHRGTAYMVMADDDLTDLRGAVPQYLFQVQRCPTAASPIVAVAAGGSIGYRAMRSTDGVNWTLSATPADTAWSGVCHSEEVSKFVAVGIGSGAAGAAMSSRDGVNWELHETPDGAWRSVAWSPQLGLFAAVKGGVDHSVMTSPDGATWTARVTPGTDINWASIVWVPWLSKFFSGNSSNERLMSSADGINWSFIEGTEFNAYEMTYTDSYVIGAQRGELTTIRSQDGVNWVTAPSGLAWGITGLAADDFFINAVSTFGAGRSANGGASFGTATVPNSNSWEAVCYSEALEKFIAVSTSGVGNRAMILQDGGWAEVETPDAADGGLWSAITAAAGASSDTCVMPLADVITELCERAGIPSSLIDVSQIDDECRGFVVINQYPCFAALRSLSEIYMFDPSNYDAKIHFIPRGGSSVATITEAEMVETEDDIDQSKRADAIQIPRVLHLNYFDVNGGLATDKQSSERAGDRRSVGEISLQSTVLMNADQAATAVVTNHKVMIEDQKGELKFALPDNWLRLVCADPVIVQWQGRSERCRISIVTTDDGFQEYTVLRDRQSAYNVMVEGIPAAPQTSPPSSVVGPTLIEPLDIPILRDSDDALGLGYYVAVSGALPAWQGATVELSMDGGATYIQSKSTEVSATMGSTVTVLNDHPAEYPDTVDTVRVRIETPLAELTEEDLTGLLNRRNLALIGNEIFQFGTVDEVSEGVWDLSYLIRGRKGTETTSHDIGSRFLMLDRGVLEFVPAELTDIGRTLTFRATSYGTTTDQGTVVSMVFTGQSQTERVPAYLSARIDGSDAVLSWQGVGRLGAGAQVAQGAYFLGYRVTIADASTTLSVDTLAQALTTDVSALTPPLTVRVSQRNQLTGLGPYIEVII